MTFCLILELGLEADFQRFLILPALKYTDNKALQARIGVLPVATAFGCLLVALVIQRRRNSCGSVA